MSTSSIQITRLSSKATEDGIQRAIGLAEFGSFTVSDAQWVCTYHPIFGLFHDIAYNQDLDVIVVTITVIPRTVTSIPLFMLGKAVQLRCTADVFDRNAPIEYACPWSWQPDPRKVLSENQIADVRRLFPRSSGIRNWLNGTCSILYANSHQLKCDAVNFARTSTLHEVPFDMVVEPKMMQTSTTATLGTQIRRDKTDLLHSAGCVGLKLNVPRLGIRFTVATHCFVGSSTPQRMIQSVAKKLGEVIARAQNAVGWRRKPSTFCSVGQQVYLAGHDMEGQLLGVIDNTYDSPSRIKPFPTGYLHDLSLVKPNDDFLDLCSPPGLPDLEPMFASAEEVLAKQECFVAFFPAVKDIRRAKVFTGKSLPEDHKKALIAGLQYNWLEQHTRSYLWRTERDDFSVAGASGSVLCLGNPASATTKAICFQNGQTLFSRISRRPRRIIVRRRPGSEVLFKIGRSSRFLNESNQLPRDSLLPDPIPLEDGNWSFKWGLFLPSEIKASEILCSSDPNFSRSSPPRRLSKYNSHIEQNIEKFQSDP